MNAEVVVNGRSWKVALEPGERPGQFTAVVKGKTRVLDAAWIDADTLSLIVGATAHEVRFQRREEGTLALTIDRRVFEAVVAGEEARQVPRAAAGARRAPPEGRRAVRSPMPGRVVRVLVAAGDQVAAGQGVVVVEAMKMENELRAPDAGVVREVRVTTGAAVEAGAVLVIVE